MSGSSSATDRSLVRSAAAPAAYVPDIALRRRAEPCVMCAVGSSARCVLTVFDRVIANGRSEALLLWPHGIEGVAVVHALAALARLRTCDSATLATLFFPWNRNAGGSQRTLLVDRDQLVRAALLPLNRIHIYASGHPAYGYLMALHSLKHLETGEDGNRRQKALQSDPGLMHPTLFEITPQAGIQPSDPSSAEHQFLQRLRRHTWINERSEYILAATDSSNAPSFLFGVHHDALSVERLREGGLDPESGGRRPDIVLIDLTRRPRNALGTGWREAVSRLLDATGKLCGTVCPPVLAITDDIFTLQALRWKVLNDYDARRGVKMDRRPAPSLLILNSKPDILDSETLVPGALDDLFVEVYASDVLSFVDSGLKLRRSLQEAGDHELASSIISAITALQNLIALPGPRQELLNFLAENYQGHELQNIGSRFDHLTPRGKINAALKLGAAGQHHAQLSAFLESYDKLCAEAETRNPGARIFQDCLTRFAEGQAKSVVAFSSDLIRAFAEWRIDNDASMADIRPKLGQQIFLADTKDALEELDRAGDCEQILFVEPFADQFLMFLARPRIPKTVRVLCHLARAKQILQRADALLDLEGISSVEWNLLLVQEQFKNALTGHSVDIPDLDAVMLPPRGGMIDLTGPQGVAAGPTRIIRTSGDLQIRAFDGSELAAYDPDALQVFSLRLASDLRPGDQVCVFTPDFIETARQRLHIGATAPEVLTLYHKAVAEGAAKLPGYDLTDKAERLRLAILLIDPSLSLPGPQSIRQWIDVAGLVNAPREEVKPQAPRERRHYFPFMKALGITEEVAKHYWDWGIFWTRSIRIRSGAAFHQVFMGVLVDPYAAAARLAEEHRQEVWRIYETAEEHVVTVISNELESKADEDC